MFISSGHLLAATCDDILAWIVNSNFQQMFEKEVLKMRLLYLLEFMDMHFFVHGNCLVHISSLNINKSVLISVTLQSNEI